MKIIEKKVGELIPYINNPRRNDGVAVDKVASSIKNFGFKVPIIIDKDNEVIAGHTRLKAAKKLKMDSVPCIVAEDLTEAQIKAFRIADNRVAEESDWDWDLLKIEIEGIDEFEIEDLGFDIDDIPDFDDDGGEVIEDEFDEEPPEDPISKRGDIWLLGRHRLMCGDSTSEDDVDILMDGNKADITFTSPPYNASQTPKEKGKYHNNASLDNKKEGEYIQFLNKFTLNCLKYSDYVFSNIQGLSNNKKALISHLYTMSEKYADTMIWNKGSGQPAMARRVLNSAFEYIYIFSHEATRAIGKKDFRGTIPNIFTLTPNAGKEYSDIHKATFRVELPAMFIDWFVETSILDVFGGTGTTLMAAEQKNKNCYMMELDEKYVDVIVNRYIKYKESDEDVYLERDGAKYHYTEVVKDAVSLRR